METIDAASNPKFAQQMLNDIMETANTVPEDVIEEQPELSLTEADDTVVNLPGGYLTFSGEVITEAEIRELTGRDEEVISRATTVEKTLSEVLARGTVRVGTEKATESTLDSLLSGDRDFLLLKIFKATFGPTVSASPYCSPCEESVDVEVDLDRDVPVRKLSSPSDRRFTVDISRGQVLCDLPSGQTQREMMSATGKNIAELSTILLKNTIVEIRGTTVVNPNQVLDLSIRDRRKIGEEILSRVPGPLLQQTSTPCPQCGTKLEVPLAMANLFRL